MRARTSAAEATAYFLAAHGFKVSSGRTEPAEDPYYHGTRAPFAAASPDNKSPRFAGASLWAVQGSNLRPWD